MHKLVLLVFFNLSCFVLVAQQADFVMVEHFTNTYCGICKSRNPALHAVMDKYEGQVHHISYHPSVPYSQCPLFNYNREGNGARQLYYNIFSTPTMYINGQRSSSSATQFESDLVEQMSQGQPVQIIVEEGSSRSRAVVVRIKTLSPMQSGNYRLLVVLAERFLAFDANNGEKEHFNVFRKMVTANDGDPISLPAPGEEMTMQFEVTVPADVSNEEAYIIAYLQNEDSKVVVGSGTKFDEVSTSAREEVLGSLALFPNPVTNYVEVEMPEGLQIHRYRVLGIHGDVFMEKEIPSGQHKATLMVESLQSGTYLLEVDHGKGLIHERFVKL